MRQAFLAILERTVGPASDDVNFPYDRYSAPDGVGCPEKAAGIGDSLCMETRLDAGFLDDQETRDLLAGASLDELWTRARERLAEECPRGLLPEAPGDEETLREFEDGHAIVSIMTPEAVRNEYLVSGMPGYVGEGTATCQPLTKMWKRFTSGLLGSK